MRTIIATGRAPQAVGPYSQAVASGGFVFLSGQIALDPATNQLAEDDIVVQTERIFENLKAVLEAGGSSLARALKATVYLREMSDFPKMNEVYARYFPDGPPARSTIQAAALPRGARVEIDLIAAAG
jgi:2-iminobutanoate/2-iminopropanoate deaminase